MDSLLEARDTLNWLDRTPPPTSPTLEPERGKDSPVPVQDNQLLNECFEAYQEYKAYTSLSGPDLCKEMMKIAFLKGANKKPETYVEHSNPFIRLYRILDKLGIDGNVSVTEQIERLIHDSFNNKAFSHDPK